MQVSEYFGLRSFKKGALWGIEIEAEGRNLMLDSPYWRLEQDGSLRGTSIEYVLNTPQTLKALEKDAFASLEREMKREGTRFNNASTRTSVHVHMNVGDLSLRQMFNIFILYSIFEDVLVAWCGESRKGNLFCLRSRDASYVLEELPGWIKEDRLARSVGNAIRYASVNLAALPKYGTLEFRAMRGTDDFDLILTWVKILNALREKALSFKDGSEILMEFSRRGPDFFFRSCFEEFLDTLGPFFDETSVVENMWAVQELAFTPIPHVEKEVAAPKKTKPKELHDPFADSLQIIDDFIKAERVADPMWIRPNGQGLHEWRPIRQNGDDN